MHIMLQVLLLNCSVLILHFGILISGCIYCIVGNCIDFLLFRIIYCFLHYLILKVEWSLPSRSIWIWHLRYFVKLITFVDRNSDEILPCSVLRFFIRNFEFGFGSIKSFIVEAFQRIKLHLAYCWKWLPDHICIHQHTSAHPPPCRTPILISKGSDTCHKNLTFEVVSI